jgi:predicted amidophosphoribosyltransferase
LEGPQAQRDAAGVAAGDALWGEIERTWIGVASGPLEQRFAEAGWQADPVSFEVYCQRCGRDVGVFEADRSGCSRCRGRRLPWTRVVRLGRYEGALREAVHELKFTAWRQVGAELGQRVGKQLAEAIACEPAAMGREILVVPVPTSFRRRMSRGIDHSKVLARAVVAELRRSPAGGGGVRLWACLARKHRPSQLSVTASERARNVAGSMRPRAGAMLAMRVRRWIGRGLAGFWGSSRAKPGPTGAGGPAGKAEGVRLGRGKAGGNGGDESSAGLVAAQRSGPLVVVLDDVMTTGATLGVAARAARLGLRRSGVGRGEIWIAMAAVTPDRGTKMES